LQCIYRGAMPEQPERNFTPIPLTQIANADISGNGAEGVPGWTGEGNNDLHEFPVGNQVFKAIPFSIVDPEKNGRKACLILSGSEGYKLNASLTVNKKAQSAYFLHTLSGGNHVGNIVINYADGSTYKTQVTRGENIAGWWYPVDGTYDQGKRPYYVAWKGENEKSLSIGVYIFGINNPHPDKMIESIDFVSADTPAKWMVLGITLCDNKVFFMPERVSFGAPDNWGAAAVTYALVEGLAGVKDEGVAFDKTLIAPRWAAAQIDDITCTIKYPASGGYASYTYKFDKDKNEIQIDFTGTASNMELEIYIDQDQTIENVYLNNNRIEYFTKWIEKSRYICISIDGIGAHKILIDLK